jgi:predicted ester cyclase
MSNKTELNKSIVRRFFNAIESGDLSVLDEIVTDTYDFHVPGQGPGRESLKRYLAGLRAALPDLQLPIRDMVAENDKVAVFNSVRGTHKGDFGPMKATGKRVDFTVFHLYRLEVGRLAEHWEVTDFATLQAQIRD